MPSPGALNEPAQHYRGAARAALTRTRIPKFGAVSTTLYNENPLKLIQVPADCQLIGEAELLREVELGMVCFVHIVRDTLKNFAPSVEPETFFQKLLASKKMRYMRGHLLLDALRDALRRACNVVG
jgi:hypothetical protein